MPPSPRITLEPALASDAKALARLHTAVAEHLTGVYGTGHWSGKTTEKGVLFALRTSRVFVARKNSAIIATLRLATKRPWAIDVSYFTPCVKALYLVGMAVAPALQRQGIGRQCLEEAMRVAHDLSADAIRLDAYDAKAGAGEFYARCGYIERGRVIYRQAPLIYYELLLG